eukprot:GILI01012926.1.p1 GENE.GILI01012926.1~~GILI01012926.1.p1  ORF type:complete len:276 (-),score=26.93 GILI01012926.1:634-1461(-)
MASDTILTIVSTVASCTGFVLFLTVLLAAYRFVAAGTVGKMSVTFYALASFNGCMWTAYGVLLGSATIALPNAWSVFTTTFALSCYFSVLGREVAEAKLKAASMPTTIGFGNDSKEKEVTYAEPPTVVAPKAEELAVESPAMIAEQLEARLVAAKKTAAVLVSLNLSTIALILLIFMASYTNTAISMTGTIGVIMATILFTGPLDQVSWIIKNKNSIPLDPLMTVVGTVNACVWTFYGFLTNDAFVWSPNVVAVLLCTMQLGLISIFPRKAIEEQ